MDARSELVRICLALVISRGVLSADLCSRSVSIGDADFKKHLDHLDELSGVTYLVNSDMYRSPCCGLIRAVKSNTLINGEVHFVVWRPTGVTDKYMVVGNFKIDVPTAPKAAAVLPSGSMQLQVKEGDLIGWYVPGESSVPYTDGEIDGQVYILSGAEEPNLGDVIDFANASKKSNRIYTIAASMDEDTNEPEFRGMSTEVKVKTTTDVGTSVLNIKVFDPQYKDSMVTVSENPYFEISNDGQSLILDSQPPGGVFILTLTSLSICGLTATLDVTVTVMEDDPVIEQPPPPTDQPVGPPTILAPTTSPASPALPTLPVPDISDASTISADYNQITVNTTLEDFHISMHESRTSLWMIFTGLSTSAVLLVCNFLIFRYAWKVYGGRYMAKTDTGIEKSPEPMTPNTEDDPEVGNGGNVPTNTDNSPQTKCDTTSKTNAV